MGANVDGDGSSVGAVDGEVGRSTGADCGKPGRVRRLERRVGDSDAEGPAAKRTGRAGIERARVGAREWVGRAERGEGGGESGRSSQVITAGDFVPIANGSEYIKEKKLKLLTFFFLERGFIILSLRRSAMG